MRIQIGVRICINTKVEKSRDLSILEKMDQEFVTGVGSQHSIVKKTDCGLGVTSP